MVGDLRVMWKAGRFELRDDERVLATAQVDDGTGRHCARSGGGTSR
jgi:hypothetical protein